jgi:hypothetical protein
VEDTEQVEALSRPANFLRSCPNTSIRQALERHQERAGLGVHRGVHATSIPDISDVNDPRNQAVSGWVRESQWARLGSNQRPPACEAGALPLSYAPRTDTG